MNILKKIELDVNLILIIFFFFLEKFEINEKIIFSLEAYILEFIGK